MSTCQKAAGPFSRCLQLTQTSPHTYKSIRKFTTTCRRRNEAAIVESPRPSPVMDPLMVMSPRNERKLMRSGIYPVGSRRRRAALRTSDNIPFEQLPYQCFQEARKVLQEDREEKLQAIQKERERIAKLNSQDLSAIPGGEKQQRARLEDMMQHIERLKILADINDPMIKKRFEDGEGDMNKPIYRYLAEKKWRSFQRLLIVQRLQQLKIVPDVFSHFQPTAEVRLAFRRRKVQPGAFIDSRVSEVRPRLTVQVFDKGERLVTVAVIDSDIPVIETDNFTSRCHFLATNIPISPSITSLPFSKVTESQLVLPWLPPVAQKGAPYHRISIIVLQQKPGHMFDIAHLKGSLAHDGFKLRAFADQNRLQPIGLNIFRSIWDEGTAGVMKRAGLEGVDVEFKRQRIEPLKPKQKARGWEARHASDKYRSLRR